MKRSIRNLMLLLSVGLLTAAPAARAVIPIAEVPLYIATPVTPNVMLLFDDSGSMDSIIWRDGFNPTVTYPDWSPLIDHDTNNGTPVQEAWTSTTSSVNYSTLTGCAYRGTCAGATNTAPTCSAGKVRGRNSTGTVTKCLTLPDPATGGATRFQGNYLNYLFNTFANGTNLTGGVVIPSQTRIQVARNVASNIVSNNANLRFGLASFNAPITGDAGPGGTIERSCGATTAQLLTTISGFGADTNTPLAETYYEITRYFRGMSSFYNTGVTYTSPIQYRCQKNFVVVVTDGYPTRDTQFPANDPADTADTTRSLPNWDNQAPTTTTAMYPNFPQYSDGFQTGSDGSEGFSLYLDDLAKFGADIDLRTSSSTPSVDLTGVSWDDPAYPKQSLTTYTVGFAVNNQMLNDAAAYGNGSYYTATNEAGLTTALQGVLAEIAARTSSAAAVATNSTRLSSDSYIYQARFSTSDWSGQLLAYPIGSNGDIGIDGEPGINEFAPDFEWDAASLIPDPNSRQIFTYNPTQSLGNRGDDFEWSKLTSTQQSWLNKNASGVTDTLGQTRLDYMRGIRTAEEQNGGTLRNRTTVLGDIINSDPAYVGQKVDYGFEALPAGQGGSSYEDFRASTGDRAPMLYVAANDGMLHGIDADSGIERFAYVPNAAYERLRYYPDKTFNATHRLINDGGPKVSDAYLGGSWKTILVGSLGGGGRGIYALDVTNPPLDEDAVMWEYSSADDNDFGFQIPSPTIARMANGDWAAVVGNGYNSDAGEAKLFIINLRTGEKIREIGTGVSGENGLSSPAAVDVDGDKIADFIYAGDLKGNLWKFDVTSDNTSEWKVAFSSGSTPVPLYTACSADPCTTSNRQPITAAPEVGLNPEEGFFVYFGTGRYFASGDNSTTGGTQTLYAIKDTNDKGETELELPSVGKSNLVQQTVLRQYVDTFGGFREEVRLTSNNPVVESKDGWYLNLPATGERIVSNPVLRGGRILFTTIIPSGDACSAGGDSWLMMIDALTGSRLKETPFDLNRDRKFNVQDFGTLIETDPSTGETKSRRVATSGRRSLQGIIKTPAAIAEDAIDHLYAAGSGGGIDQVDANASLRRGRQSWREVTQ